MKISETILYEELVIVQSVFWTIFVTECIAAQGTFDAVCWSLKVCDTFTSWPILHHASSELAHPLSLSVSLSLHPSAPLWFIN